MEVTRICNSAGENQDLVALPCHPQLWMLRFSVGKVMVLRVRLRQGFPWKALRPKMEKWKDISLLELSQIFQKQVLKQVSELCTLGFGFLSSIIGW